MSRKAACSLPLIVELHPQKEDSIWHLSIPHPRRYPFWDEIKQARYYFLPDDVTMATLLPPKEEYVNIHPNCFHLYQLRLEEDI